MADEDKRYVVLRIHGEVVFSGLLEEAVKVYEALPAELKEQAWCGTEGKPGTPAGKEVDDLLNDAKGG